MLTLPIPVPRALRTLGRDIKNARRRRRIAMAIVAERASVSKPTLIRVIRVEPGNPTVSIGCYATVLFLMGMADRLADLADAKHDPVALPLKQENLPRRIRGANPLCRGQRKRTMRETEVRVGYSGSNQTNEEEPCP